MSFLNEIKDELPLYGELESDDERLVDLRAYILDAEEDDLIKELATIDPGSESGIDTIYEVFGELDKCDRFGNLIFKEIQRSFSIAKKSAEPDDCLYAATELCFFDYDNKKFEEDIVHYLEQYLNDEDPIIRHGALTCLDDCLFEENVQQYGGTIEKIRRRLKDKNWKVRHMAYDCLIILDRLPKDYEVSFFDKLRFKFLA